MPARHHPSGAPRPRRSPRDARGRGLGLAIVRELIALHHGTARAESAGVGRGARSTVLLPTVPAARTPVQPALRSEPSDLSMLDLLLVEDDRDTRVAELAKAPRRD